MRSNKIQRNTLNESRDYSEMKQQKSKNKNIVVKNRSDMKLKTNKRWRSKIKNYQKIVNATNNNQPIEQSIAVAQGRRWSRA